MVLATAGSRCGCRASLAPTARLPESTLETRARQTGGCLQHWRIGHTNLSRSEKRGLCPTDPSHPRAPRHRASPTTATAGSSSKASGSGRSSTVVFRWRVFKSDGGHSLIGALVTLAELWTIVAPVSRDIDSEKGDSCVCFSTLFLA